MNFTETRLKGAWIVEVDPSQDERGLFFRTFCKNEFSKIGHNKEFVQFNHSVNTKKGTVRGMHFQAPPFAEIKLVRCIRGSVWDVLVDLRKSSSTFMEWTGIELTEGNRKMIYIPEGFAHGFQVLEDNTELLYHHTGFYEPRAEMGIRYNDEKIGIQWPLEISLASEKDKTYSLLTESFKGLEV